MLLGGRRFVNIVETGVKTGPKTVANILAKIVLAGAVLSAFASNAAAQDRMPPIAPDKMTDAQKKVVAAIVSGPRGALVGPFIPLLRSPDLMDRLQKTGEYI